MVISALFMVQILFLQNEFLSSLCVLCASAVNYLFNRRDTEGAEREKKSFDVLYTKYISPNKPALDIPKTRW
ncbi:MULTISPECIES: hypothetical protein [unclassified Nostoc]|uniref:hypothetical protein n=1 Tax=unclassified Nostoc TaxID=2593658 RepID=UPI001D754FE2|nr:hypothetical protein [Nostoc sp. JL23]MBN3879540.1 hypothetical protein [Nostoc sp. JL23]